MGPQLVYDLPTRLFHWLFAGLFLTAYAIGQLVDDDSATFSYHMLAGLTLGFLVLLRVIWGFFGTKHARFSDFALNPKDLIGYLQGILSGDKTRWAGHNPASSWAAITMMLLGVGLGVTGYLMTSGPDKETYEEAHELLANGFLVVAILHIAGVIFHTIRHKEIIGLSMVHGKKDAVAIQEGIPSSRPVFGVLLIGLVVVFAVHLFKNYDPATRNLNFLGATLQLGEQEGQEHDKPSRTQEDRDDD